jgi:transglutaminase-like putative cysteine protease
MMTPEPVEPGLAPYLAADDVIDDEHPQIRALAARLRGDSREATAEAAFEYVRDRIHHSSDVQRWSAAYRASDVLAEGDAICHGKAHLLAALLRAEGIPAGLCYQRLNVLHAMVAVHWAGPGPSGGNWVRLDARGNRPAAAGQDAVDARFALVPGEERLAFPGDCYPGVYAAVPAELQAGLATKPVGKAGYGHLPTELSAAR